MKRACSHPDQNLAGQDPEELIECSESWPRVPAFQCRELLAKGQVFKKQAATRSEEAKDHSRQEPKGDLSCAGAIAIRLWRATPILLKS